MKTISNAGTLLMLTLWLIAGCAQQKPNQVPIAGFYSELRSCRARYAEFDAKIDAAGVRDTAFYRVPGFPYLRTDRLLASYRNQVQSVDEVGGWIRRMHEFDQEAREFELRNLGLSSQEVAILRFEFLNCGRGLSALEFDDPQNLALLRATAVPPDDYSSRARALGLYPLALPFLHANVSSNEAALRTIFAKPVDQLLGASPSLRWQVQPVEDLSLIPRYVHDSTPDELGLPGLVDSAWRAIAEANAPELLMSGGSGARALGTPIWTRAGIDVDTTRPWVNYQIGFTRFGSRALVQVDYFFWLRVPDAAGTGAAAIDGLIWRVTLDDHLKPMIYESLRASGREHFWFTVEDAGVRKAGSYLEQAAFFPQPTPAPSAASLVIDSASGGVRKVAAAGSLPATASRQYELHRYEDLYELPRPEGGSRSLFEADGRIVGTHSDAPGWLLASGIQDPGALRHLSHLPTDYVGRRHFDDPFLLESVFVPPVLPGQAADSASSSSQPSAGSH